ncbi:hypothetical protein SLEP1_g27478 [Rubroshorea leprosula]|uniref:B3 domain-containing protein n=1 Tax=Rubroshorea leprosula TaxID=152421 RepID=A0AAV5JQN7_9ROSI|nr:hypothetical protein SLEP1_g27478 [Rubroshorea leprosula]
MVVTLLWNSHGSMMDLNIMDVNGSLTLFHYSKKAPEKAIRKPKQCSFHSHCSVPPFRLDFYVSKKQRSNRGKAMMCTNTIDLLTEEEARKLDGEEGLNVVLIEPCLEKSRIHLTKWSMGNSKVFVFNEQWNSVVEGNKTLMKKNAVMQIC